MNKQEVENSLELFLNNENVEHLRITSHKLYVYDHAKRSFSFLEMPYVGSTLVGAIGASNDNPLVMEDAIMFTRVSRFMDRDFSVSKEISGVVKASSFDRKRYDQAMSCMSEGQNESLRASLEKSLKTDDYEIICEHIATSNYTAVYNIPTVIKEEFSIDVEVSEAGPNVAKLEVIILKNGAPYALKSGDRLNWDVDTKPAIGATRGNGGFDTGRSKRTSIYVTTDYNIGRTISLQSVNVDQIWHIDNTEGFLVSPGLQIATDDPRRPLNVRYKEYLEDEIKEILTPLNLFNVKTSPDIKVGLFVFQQYSGAGGQRLQTSTINGEKMFPAPFTQEYPDLKWEWEINGVPISTEPQPRVRDFTSKFSGVQLITGRATHIPTGEVYEYEEMGFMVFPDTPIITDADRYNPNNLYVPTPSEVEA